jgi:hypothetical protein
MGTASRSLLRSSRYPALRNIEKDWPMQRQAVNQFAIFFGE